MEAHAPLADDWSRLPVDAALSALVDLVEIHQRSGPLLDVGCGSGRVHEALVRRLVLRPLGYVGVDGDGDRVDHARGRYPGTDFRVLPPGELPLAPGSAGAVICADGLGGFASFGDFAAKAVRIAREHVFVLVPLDARTTDEDVLAAFEAAGARVLDFQVMETTSDDVGLVRAGVAR